VSEDTKKATEKAQKVIKQKERKEPETITTKESAE
jgi:hypothetical protein